MTDLRERIGDIIHDAAMASVSVSKAADAILALPEISNAQSKIAEIENALAAASGTIAAMRADVATDQARIANLEAALFRSKVAWENALEIGLFPKRYAHTVEEIVKLTSDALKAKP
jgi:thiamine biosynthesis protein ThiC